MKNLSLILNVVLLIAVGVLYFLFFNQKNATAELQPATTGERAESVIAYINSDTLLNNYALSKDIQRQLEELEKKYEAEFANRAKGLENEVAQFQRTAQSMTIGQARSREEELLRKRNNLMQYQESLSQKLMQEQAKLNQELYENVSDYLKEYGRNRELDVVLTYTKGSGVLYASDSLDITQDVIAGLNENYNTAKAEPATASASEEAKN